MIVTIPLINRLAKNIRDNLSFEVFLGKNQKELIKRVYFLPGIERQQANLFKIIVEKPARFDLYMVPEWVWKRYWEMRLDLTEEALATLEGTVDMEELEDYVLVKDAASHAGLNPNTIQQAISRGIYRGRKVGGLLAIHREDMNDHLEIKGKPKLGTK
ncbi:MAG: hypothetical protein JSV27_11640 [Candidatus Bathyarchaeota archaeon]|nr:MAG: hypothetical protein JSV27_11640 [Candidatus Bathyarchaeota archaeon]